MQIFEGNSYLYNKYNYYRTHVKLVRRSRRLSRIITYSDNSDDDDDKQYKYVFSISLTLSNDTIVTSLFSHVMSIKI